MVPLKCFILPIARTNVLVFCKVCDCALGGGKMERIQTRPFGRRTNTHEEGGGGFYSIVSYSTALDRRFSPLNSIIVLNDRLWVFEQEWHYGRCYRLITVFSFDEGYPFGFFTSFIIMMLIHGWLICLFFFCFCLHRSGKLDLLLLNLKRFVCEVRFYVWFFFIRFNFTSLVLRCRSTRLCFVINYSTAFIKILIHSFVAISSV